MPITIGPRHSLFGDVGLGLASFLGGYGQGKGQHTGTVGSEYQSLQSQQAKAYSQASAQNTEFMQSLALQHQQQQDRMQLQASAAQNAMSKLGAAHASAANAAYMKGTGVALMYPDEMPGYEAPAATAGTSCADGHCGSSFTTSGAGSGDVQSIGGPSSILAAPQGAQPAVSTPQRPPSVWGQWQTDLHGGRTLDDWPTYASNFAKRKSDSDQDLAMARANMVKGGFDNDAQQKAWQEAQAKEQRAMGDPTYFDPKSQQWTDIGVQVRRQVYNGLIGPHPVPREQTMQDLVNSGKAFGQSPDGTSWYNPKMVRPYQPKAEGSVGGMALPPGIQRTERGTLLVPMPQPNELGGGPPAVIEMTPGDYQTRMQAGHINGQTVVWDAKGTPHPVRDEQAEHALKVADIRTKADIDMAKIAAQHLQAAETQRKNDIKAYVDRMWKRAMKDREAVMKQPRDLTDDEKKNPPPWAMVANDPGGLLKKLEADAELHYPHPSAATQPTPQAPTTQPVTGVAPPEVVGQIKAKARAGDVAAQALLKKHGETW